MQKEDHWQWYENKEEQKDKGEVRCLSLTTPGGILCRYWGAKDPPEAAEIAGLPQLKADLAEAKEAIKGMFAACDEWAAEFTQKRRAMNWGVVNDAYVRAERILKKK